MLIADITDLCHSYIDRYENIEDKDAVLHMSELFMFKMHSLTPLLKNIINKKMKRKDKMIDFIKKYKKLEEEQDNLTQEFLEFKAQYNENRID